MSCGGFSAPVERRSGTYGLSGCAKFEPDRHRAAPAPGKKPGHKN